MKLENNNTKIKKYQHLSYEEKIKIEILLKSGKTSSEIAKLLNYSTRTIQRERKRGMLEQCKRLTNKYYKKYTVYSPELSHEKYCSKFKNKGCGLKIGRDFEFAYYIKNCIVKHKMSPYACLQNIKIRNLKFNTNICVKTLYNYIDKRVIPEVTNKHLPVKNTKKPRNYNKIRRAYTNKTGLTITERPPEIERREEFGHYEMDTVIGKKTDKTCLLVLTERKTRHEIIRIIPSKTKDAVKTELKKIIDKTFKTITCDNGSEFVGINTIKGIPIYYAHPYSAWERGSNENANKLIRRYIEKGKAISDYTKEFVQYVQDKINNYPRKLLDGYPSNNLYQKELSML